MLPPIQDNSMYRCQDPGKTIYQRFLPIVPCYRNGECPSIHAVWTVQAWSGVGVGGNRLALTTRPYELPRCQRDLTRRGSS